MQALKFLGGLGVPCLHLLNLAYFMKLVWHLLNPDEDGLWKQILLKKYNASDDLWDSYPTINSLKFLKDIYWVKTHVFLNLH